METAVKRQTILEVKINDRRYALTLDPDSPLGEAHDAVMEIKGFLVERMVQEYQAEKEAAEKQKQLDEDDDGS